MGSNDQKTAIIAVEAERVFDKITDNEYNTRADGINLVKSAIEEAVVATESRCAGEAAEILLNHPIAAHASVAERCVEAEELAWPHIKAAHASEPRDPDDFTPTRHCLGTAHASERWTKETVRQLWRENQINVEKNDLYDDAVWDTFFQSVANAHNQDPTPATDDTKRLDWIIESQIGKALGLSREAIDTAMSQTKEKE